MAKAGLANVAAGLREDARRQKVRDRRREAGERRLSRVLEAVCVPQEPAVMSTAELARVPLHQGYALRGLWFREDRYGPLRNAAWLLRASRVGQGYNPAALKLVLHEAEKLLASREQLGDVLEAFAELLIHG